MKVLLSVLLASMLFATPAARATEQASPDDAKAMAIKAAAYLKSVGPETAFAAFDGKEGPWHDRDLYVTVVDDKGVVEAQGNNVVLVGKTVLDLKDIDGQPFIRAFLAVKDAGWVDYKWQNPVTKSVEAKTAYQVRVGDYVVGVGAYAH